MVFLKPARKPAVLLIAVFFLSSQILNAAPPAGITMLPKGELPSLLQVEIPSDIANVDEIYEAPPSASPRLILHIQNIHGSYEAQVQIKKLLHYLREQYGFNLIFAEGAVTNLNPEILRIFPDKELNLKIADNLTRRGELTGVEYYLIDGPEDVRAVGIEKSELYRANYDAFQKVHAASDKVNAYLERFEARLETLSSQVFSKDSRRILSEWKKFETGRRDFLPFINTVVQDTKNILGIDLESLFAQVDWPQITRLLVLQGMEKDLDVKAAEKERVRLVEFLKEKKISPEIISAVEKLGERKITMARLDSKSNLEDLPRYLFERLISEAGPKGFYFHDYPQFSLWAGRIILERELDSSSLFEEIEKLFDKMLDELCVTERDKNLLELYRDEALLKKLLHLEVTRKESERVVYRKDWITPESMAKRLEALGSTFQKDPGKANEPWVTSPGDQIRGAADDAAASLPVLRKSSGISQPAESLPEGVLEEAFRFYDLARKRETGFFSIIENEMKEKGVEKGILVTGGFHTEGIKELFKENSISYSTLTPKITGDIDNSNYVSAMMGSQVNMFDLATLEIFSSLQGLIQIQSQGADGFSHTAGLMELVLGLVEAKGENDLYEKIGQINEKFGAPNGFELFFNKDQSSLQVRVLDTNEGDALRKAVEDHARKLDVPEDKAISVSPENFLQKGNRRFQMRLRTELREGESILRINPATLGSGEKDLSKEPSAPFGPSMTAAQRSEMRSINRYIRTGEFSDPLMQRYPNLLISEKSGQRPIKPYQDLWAEHYYADEQIIAPDGWEQLEEIFILPYFGELHEKLEAEKVRAYGPHPQEGQPGPDDVSSWPRLSTGELAWGGWTSYFRRPSIRENKPGFLGHEQRVTIFLVQALQLLGLSESTIAIAAFAGAHHDFGKIFTPLTVLNKEGKLTSQEFEVMKEHVSENVGQNLIRLGVPKRLVDAMLGHHKYGGMNKIRQLISSWMEVADVAAALSEERPYKPGISILALSPDLTPAKRVKEMLEFKGMTLAKVIKILLEERGVKLDPVFVDVMLANFIVNGIAVVGKNRLTYTYEKTTVAEVEAVARVIIKEKADQQAGMLRLEQIYNPLTVQAIVERRNAAPETDLSDPTDPALIERPIPDFLRIRGMMNAARRLAREAALGKRSEMRMGAAAQKAPESDLVFDTVKKQLRVSPGMDAGNDFYLAGSGVTFNLKNYNLKTEAGRRDLLNALKRRLSAEEQKETFDYFKSNEVRIRSAIKKDGSPFLIEQFEALMKILDGLPQTHVLDQVKQRPKEAVPSISFKEIIKRVLAGELDGLDLSPSQFVALGTVSGILDTRNAKVEVPKMAQKIEAVKTSGAEGEINSFFAKSSYLKVSEAPASVMVVMDHAPTEKFLNAVAVMLMSQTGVNLHLLYANPKETAQTMARLQKKIQEKISKLQAWEGVDAEAIAERLKFTAAPRAGAVIQRIMPVIQRDNQKEKAKTMKQNEYKARYLVQLFIGSGKDELKDMLEDADPQARKTLGMVRGESAARELDEAGVWLALQIGVKGEELDPEVAQMIGKPKGNYSRINESRLMGFVSKVMNEILGAIQIAIAA